MKTCTVSDCGRRLLAKGYCSTHYRWLKEGKDFSQPVRAIGQTTDCCSVPNCDNESTGNGYCRRCNKRWRTWGPVQPIVNKISLIDSSGYERWSKHHPLNSSGKIRYAHHVVMENHLGRPLMDGENVHHINGDRSDNRLENLELWNTSQPSGQRVVDKVAWAREILRLYG